MQWWVWVIVVGVVLAAVLAFFEWRSWNKPLSPGLEGTPRWTDGGAYARRRGNHGDLDEPRD
jgi:hypothetical protein